MDVKAGWLRTAAIGIGALGLLGCDERPYSFNESKPAVILFTKLDSATVTVDLPRGIALKPEGNRLTLTTKQGTRTVQARDFPLTEISREALPDEKTRYVLSMGKERTEELLEFWNNGSRLSNYRVPLPVTTGITPGLALCRTETIPDDRSAIIMARVWIESLPAIAPMRVDLREEAHSGGTPLNSAYEPCAPGR